MNIRVLLIVISALLISCESDPQATFGFQDEGMRKFIIEGLEKREIWFRREDSDRITVFEKDFPIVKKLGAEFSERTIPFGRSVGVNSGAQPVIEEALKKAGVKYRVSSYGAATLPLNAEELGMSSEWIVFEPGHEARGFEIISRVNENFDFWAESEAARVNK